MPNGRPRRSSLFSALVLILFGALFLLHNYAGGFHLMALFHRWWPLLFILLGLAKLAEHMTTREGTGARRPVVTAGEIFLVFGLLALAGLVVLGGFLKEHAPDIGADEAIFGEPHSFEADVSPMTVPPGAHIAIHSGRGDIMVHAEDSAEIRVSAKKLVRAWSERDAQRLADGVRVEIAPAGEGYEVRVPGDDSAGSRVSVDLDVAVPSKCTVSVRSDQGDVDVSRIGGELSVDSRGGDVTARNVAGDVDIEARRGDVKVSEVQGNVKVSGRGGAVEVENAKGGLTLNGEFSGPIHGEQIAKGVRLVSHQMDLTLTELHGHFEAGSGNLEINDSSGNLNLRTSSSDISLENLTGKIQLDNRDANVNVRFSSPPKSDIEITNSSAPIVITLPASSAFEIVADCHSCEIDSEFDAATLKKTTSPSGDTHLEGKLGTRGPKIILKTSYGSISLHKGT